MTGDKAVIDQNLRAFVPRGTGQLAAAIEVEWLRAPVRLEPSENGAVLVCTACDGGGTHDRYQPGPRYRELTRDYLAIRAIDDLVAFVEQWGMISPVLRYAEEHLNPRHVGAGATERSDFALLSVLNARYANLVALRPAVEDDALDAQREKDRRIAFAGLQTELSGMNVWFSGLDEGLAVRFVPSSLRQVVAIALLGVFRGGLPIACAACGGPLPDQIGPGRPRRYCGDTCASRAAYDQRRRKRNRR